MTSDPVDPQDEAQVDQAGDGTGAFCVSAKSDKVAGTPKPTARFRGLRLRPALDLLAQVGSVPEGDVIDLGCGDGAAAGALRLAYPNHRLTGLDASPAMLATARGYERLGEADATVWTADTPPALFFSNAALQWLPDHAVLLPRLAAMLALGGVLAVQMPRQYFAPSHRFLRDIAVALFPDRFDFSRYEAPVQPAQAYWQMLQPLGEEPQAWETEYMQHLQPVAQLHPVQAFTQSTAMRPFMDKLTADEAETFTAAYDQALTSAYSLLPDGSCLMPFRRVFFTAKVLTMPILKPTQFTGRITFLGRMIGVYDLLSSQPCDRLSRHIRRNCRRGARRLRRTFLRSDDSRNILKAEC